MKLKYFIPCIFLQFFSCAFAIIEQYQEWPTINLNGMAGAIRYNLNAQARIIPQENTVQQYIIRPALGYQLSPRLTVWLGYQWISTNVGEDSVFSGREDRIWQRLDWILYENSVVRFDSASRLEERKEAAFPQWAQRFRQRFAVSFPKLIFSSITPIISEELFFNINKPEWIPPETYEQNRFYAGFLIPFNSTFSLNIGYLNQYQFRTPQDQMNHILFAEANIQID